MGDHHYQLSWKTPVFAPGLAISYFDIPLTLYSEAYPILDYKFCH